MLVSKLFDLRDQRDYKIHLANWNGFNHPLDVFVRDKFEWEQWNSWRSTRDEFNRKYIFSLIKFYPETDMWLFGGIFEVLGRGDTNQAHSYEIRLVEDRDDLIGRLKVRFARPSRAKSVRLENHLKDMTVAEIFATPYDGQVFPGYENINHDFSHIETVIRTNKIDWKSALMSVKGVYVIFDRSNGKKYVGAAYGDTGIWARWTAYVQTGHGANDELLSLIKKNGIQYARDNFRFCLLEYRPAKTDDQTIINREVFWKEALLSRLPHGYNKN